jgi:hypothetical protein
MSPERTLAARRYRSCAMALSREIGDDLFNGCGEVSDYHHG